jgi:hypothetical protein
MTPPKPQAEHHWLQQLVGEWRAEFEAQMEPDKPAETFTSTETVRSIGDIWVICEHRGQMPGGGEATGIITLGFDPELGRFVGTFVGSMMTHHWIYEGQLDTAGKVLTLNTVGPNYDAGNTLTNYRESIEFQSPDQRTFVSEMLGTDGQWQTVMKMTYKRAK